jgi:hypothetical protein
MTATAADAQFVRQPFRIVKFGPDTTIVAAWGDSARRTQEPIETHFESEADSQAKCDERGAIMSAYNRRMSVTVLGEKVGMDMNYLGVALTARVIDADRALDRSQSIHGIVLDFNQEQTRLETHG